MKDTTESTDPLTTDLWITRRQTTYSIAPKSGATVFPDDGSV